jgi:hypothetical protein
MSMDVFMLMVGGGDFWDEVGIFSTLENAHAAIPGTTWDTPLEGVVRYEDTEELHIYVVELDRASYDPARRLARGYGA